MPAYAGKDTKGATPLTKKLDRKCALTPYVGLSVDLSSNSETLSQQPQASVRSDDGR